MTPLADTAQRRSAVLLRFLEEELAPRPGRVAAAARIAGSCAVVVAIAMLYQVPLPAYMAYIVFLISRDEAASTLLTGVVGALAATVAVALSLLFYTLDAAEPALRLPLMAGSAFAGMFMARTLTLGPVAFLASFVLVLSQTLIDEVPTLEGLTHFVLWLWVVAIVPDTLTILVNLAIGENPTRLARRTALSLLQALARALRHGAVALLPQLRAEAIALLELRARAGMLDRGLASRTDIDTDLIETLAELLTLVALLPADVPAEIRLQLAASCDASIAAFEAGDAPVARPALPGEAILDTLSPATRPVTVALIAALERLADGIQRRRTAVGRPASAAAKTILTPDALSNPEHVRFALKTTIAVMAAYCIYSGLDWPGISTAITTCFFVSLGSLGETMHKLTLRIGGAAIGGLAGGLCIVFLLPDMTDIGQLCLLIAAVSFACAWVATSSERLAYAGMQTAFAFFLGVLQGYGPATDLTVLRDRLVGILLGNLLISLVFSVVWPVSALERARACIAVAMRALGSALTGGGDDRKTGSRLAVLRALGDAHRFVSIAAFELSMLPSRSRIEAGGGPSLGALDRLAAAVFVVIDQKTKTDVHLAYDTAAATWFATAADQLATSRTVTVEALPSETGRMAMGSDMSASLRAATEARMLLQAEIGNAVLADS